VERVTWSIQGSATNEEAIDVGELREQLRGLIVDQTAEQDPNLVRDALGGTRDVLADLRGGMVVRIRDTLIGADKLKDVSNTGCGALSSCTRVCRTRGGY
jgi:hypothetical protein